MLEAIILVGGKGTRLKSISGDTPKPLVEIGGKPFLYWILESLQEQGFSRVVLATGYRSDFLKNKILTDCPVNIELIFSEEKAPLGTGGAIKSAFKFVSSNRVLVMNGDSYCDINFRTALESGQKIDKFITMIGVHVDNVERYGAIEVDGQGNLLRMTEKGSRGPGYINSGIYVVDKLVIEAVPNESFSFEGEVLSNSLSDISCYMTEDYFVDIGVPVDYKLANKYFYEKNSISR
ncbi:MAG: sugar phosphate nucleotidyltransferase [Colwellia sp.]